MDSTLDTFLLISSLILIGSFLFSPEILGYLRRKGYLIRLKYFLFPKSRIRHLERNSRDLWLIDYYFNKMVETGEPYYSKTVQMSDGLTVKLKIEKTGGRYNYRGQISEIKLVKTVEY